MSLLTPSIHSSLLSDAVVVTGAPRSGTTLLGKLVGSFERLEYHFEPPSLRMIVAAHARGDISRPIANALLRVYLAEDLLLEAVHGRTANLRPSDDSQILNRMSWAELNDRWHNVRNRGDAIDRAITQNLRFAAKMPLLYDGLDLLEEACPDLFAVLSVRNGNDVVRSIIQKKWVTKEGLSRELWPYTKICPETVNRPYWVPERYHEIWASLSVASRACIMWAHHAELGLERVAERQGSARLIQIRYEDLLTEPWPTVNALAERLETAPTQHTRMWVERISTPKSMRSDSSRDFASDVVPEILDWFDSVNAAWGYT